MRTSLASLLALSLVAGIMPATTPSVAADCTGHVINVQPPSAYNPRTGTGFLAVRSGPGADFAKIGELYAGDEVAVFDRRGNWYAVTCMQGLCMRPLWGEPMPRGWSHGRYLRLGGVCP